MHPHNDREKNAVDAVHQCELVSKKGEVIGPVLATMHMVAAVDRAGWHEATCAVRTAQAYASNLAAPRTLHFPLFLGPKWQLPSCDKQLQASTARQTPLQGFASTHSRKDPTAQLHERPISRTAKCAGRQLPCTSAPSCAAGETNPARTINIRPIYYLQPLSAPND